MEKLFKPFYGLEDEDFKELWDKAVFVFDTNVLLNLYRYKKSTANELLKVLDSIKNRIWLPYYAALEYQRNRLTVISEQTLKFHEAKKVIESQKDITKIELEKLKLEKRHSLIDPKDFIKDIEEATDKFIKKLLELEREHIDLAGKDNIREKIDSLFQSKVGEKFNNQDELDKIYKEAKKRYQQNIPPGYMDIDKEKNPNSTQYFDGIKYNTAFGDYLIWYELLEYSKDNSLKNVIFITDDNKEDWWLKLNNQGLKTISPRIELISEIKHYSNVERFYMYSSERFTTYANEYLDTKISKDAINEIKDYSQKSNVNNELSYSLQDRRILIKSFERWLTNNYNTQLIRRFIRYDKISAIIEGIKLSFTIQTYNSRSRLNKDDIHPVSKNHYQVVIVPKNYNPKRAYISSKIRTSKYNNIILFMIVGAIDNLLELELVYGNINLFD